MLKDAEEIIVVDGRSSDDSELIARQHGARTIVSQRGRGIQLHAGAQAASGDWLLFLHADTLLGFHWRSAADQHITTAPHAAGHFRFRLASDAWQARLIEAGVRLRVRLLGLPYGDQALLISRELYHKVGGYKPLPLLEDVDLIRRLGRRRLRPVQADAVTSAARWQQDGWFVRSVRNIACLALYLAGASPNSVARLYRPSSREGCEPQAEGSELQA